MSDMGEDFKLWKADKTAKKEANLKSSTELLEHNNIHFESKNGGVHLIILHGGRVIHFWPSTGKWTPHGSGEYYRGVRKLLTHIAG